MQIAAVVHNTVRKDARVIKEAVSLTAAGHTVTVHGISDTDKAESFLLPGTCVRVRLSAKLSPLASGLEWLANPWLRRPLYFAVLVAFVGTLTALTWSLLRAMGLDRGALLESGLALAAMAVMAAVLGLSAFIFRRHLGVLLMMCVRATRVRWLYAKLRQRAAWLIIQKFPQSDLAARLAVKLQRKNFERMLNPLMASLANGPRPDAVHLHDAVALLLADTVREQFGCPIVWDAHEIYEDMSGANVMRGLLNAGVIRAQAPFVDRFVTINESIGAFYADRYPKLPAGTVLMNATDRAFPPLYDGRLHQAAGLPATQKVLLFQGGFATERGLIMLAQAAPLLLPHWTLVLMGWGKMEAELKDLAASLHRPGAVPHTAFLPGVPHHELQEWSAGAALGAITYENTSLNHLYCTPNKLWEYPSAGVPILASDLEELGRAVRRHNIGYLLPRAFGTADIVRVVNGATEHALAPMRAACRLFMETNSWAAYEPRLLEIYARLASRPACATSKSSAEALKAAA